MRSSFPKGEERNLFRKGLTKNLYCSFYQVEQMAKKLKRTTNSFIRDKKELKDDIIDLKTHNSQENEKLKNLFNPEVKRLIQELNDHQKEQNLMNKGFESQMIVISETFDKMQNNINKGVESLNGIDEVVGIDTNFF